MKQILLSAALIAGALGLSAPAYATIVVGPGTDIGSSVLYDGGGTRTNVALSSPITLSPGNYSAANFSFVAGAIGDVEPFLAVLSSGTLGTSNQVFSLIAVGSDNLITSSADYGTQTVAFGGSNTFVIPIGGETVYAGITGSTGNNPVELTQSTGSDAHNTSGFPIADFIVGGTLSQFSYPSIGREYAFSVSVTPASLPSVPTPSTGLLLLSGGTVLLGFAALRKRRPAW